MTAEQRMVCDECPSHPMLVEQREDDRNRMKEMKHAIDNIAIMVDTTAGKVNIMWNWKYIVGAVFSLFIAGLFFLIQDAKQEMRDNSSAIQITIETAKILAGANRESSINRDQLLADRFLKLHEENVSLITSFNRQTNQLINEIINVMNVISLNQKRVMGEIELDYMEPDYGDRKREGE